MIKDEGRGAGEVWICCCWKVAICASTFAGRSKDVAADEGEGIVELLESEELESITERRSARRAIVASFGICVGMF